MNILIKELDKNNNCNICKVERDNDIIIQKGFICEECYKNISNLKVEDFNYYFYKNKIKRWLTSKYRLEI